MYLHACIYMYLHGDRLTNLVARTSDKSKPMSQRSKHIDTRVYKLRDLTAEKIIKLVKIPTGEQFADCLTKPLASATVANARTFLCGETVRALVARAAKKFSS